MGRHAKHNAHWRGRKLGHIDSQSAAEDQFDDVVEEVLIHTVTDEQELDSAVPEEPQQGEADEDDVE